MAPILWIALYLWLGLILGMLAIYVLERLLHKEFGFWSLVATIILWPVVWIAVAGVWVVITIIERKIK